MKIVIYVRPGTDPSSYARSIKSIVEEETKQPCNIKVSESMFKTTGAGERK